MSQAFPKHLEDCGRLILSDCPGCDEPVSLENVHINEQILCPNCKSLILLVRIDGVIMFLREGWT